MKHGGSTNMFKRSEGVNEIKESIREFGTLSPVGEQTQRVWGHGKENKTGSPHYTGQVERLSRQGWKSQ